MKYKNQMMIHATIILTCMISFLCNNKYIQKEEIVPEEYSIQGTITEKENIIKREPTVVEEIKTETKSEVINSSESAIEVQHYPKFKYKRNWTKNEEYLLAKIAECEGGNQNVQTRSLIIMVVLNRVESDKFPDTIKEVIYHNNNGVYQFSPLCSGGSWWNIEPTQESYDAVKLVKQSEYDYSGGALYFEAFASDEIAANSWHGKNLEFLYKSENTRFYK